MSNKNNYNKLFNLKHKTDYYLTNNYENNFQYDEWDSDHIMNFEDNIPINDDYNNEQELSNKYSFSQNTNIFK